MVYFLRPRYNVSPTLSASKSPLLSSPLPPSMSPSRLSAVPQQDQSSNSELTLQRSGMLLLIAGIVAAIVYVVLVKGVKPSADKASFLTTKDDNGVVSVSQPRVIILSVVIGLLVALVSHAVSP